MDSLDLAMELDERDREVIADSEDESLGRIANAPKLASISDISSFTNQQLTINLPTISSFTNSENLGDTSKITGFETDFSMGPLSIADRAKTRPRRNKVRVFDPIDDASSSRYPNDAPVDRSDIIELTDDEDELALLPLKPRPKPKPRAKPQTNLDPDNSYTAVLDTVKSKPRPRPKPKPVTKTTSDIPSPHTDTPGSIIPKPRPKPRPITKKIPFPRSPDSISQDKLSRHVSPLSPLPAPIPFHLVSSQLPPSDPPPTSTPDDDVPRIETLPNPGTDFDIPTSSPASLFGMVKSPGGPGQRKRNSNAIDELDSDDAPGQMDDRRMMPPPPTFFAGSSSSVVSEGARSEALLNAEMIDQTALPPTIDSCASLGKKVMKPRKPRKKKGENDADSGEKAKSKPKPKPKARKNQVEVVITLPPSNAKSTAKGKGKEEGAFKSKEFIDDDEEEDIPVTRTKRTSAKPDSITSLSSIPPSEDDGGVIKSVPKKRKPPPDDPADQTDETLVTLKKKLKSKGKEKITSEERTETPPPAKKDSAGAKGRGRKVVFSEDEDQDGFQEENNLPSTRTREPDKRGKKGRRNVIQDDDPGDGDTTHNQQLDDQDPTEAAKENVLLQPKISTGQMPTSDAETPAKSSLFPTLASRYTLAPKTKATPMSELIRRVNSLPGSPFISPAPRATMSRQESMGAGTAYSPYLKSSRALLSRIAPLHPNRRTPPPPLPPPPPRKKTKKELEMEERWEEELVESVGGVTEWACMTDEERRDLRRAKRERETFGWDD